MSSSRRCQIQIQQRNRVDILGWGFRQKWSCWSQFHTILITHHRWIHSKNSALLSFPPNSGFQLINLSSPSCIVDIDRGRLERWNAGTLERWNPELLILTTRPGMLERWNAGTLEYWQWGQERWNARMLEPLLVRGSNNFCYLNFNTILLIFINKDFIKKVNNFLFWLFFIFNEVLHLTALT